MKKAIGYIRISDKDQSNFSLDGQEKYIRDFCSKHNYELLNVFRDEGRSAKNFDRPDWKQLENFCKENFKQVHCLVVAKYDRFSRNLKDALNMIEMLEERYSIRILSVMEPIMMDPRSPYFFQFRTQMLMGAQLEWLVIRDRTRFGNHHAAKAGRCIHMAPFGYINKRDEQNKPIIVLDESKAPIVRKAFSMLLQGAPLAEIYIEIKRMGYGNKGNSAMKRLLSNPLYAGLILVPEYNEEPGGLVKGIHEPIIDQATWYRAQEILNPPKKTRQALINEEVPLRAVLKCFCGKCLTAGKSKGKQNYYWYYKCNDHKQVNLSANKLHTQFDDLLKELSLPEHYLLYLQQAIEHQLQLQYDDKEKLTEGKKREMLELHKKMEKLEEKYLEDDLDIETFKKWKDRYQKEIAICRQYISDFSVSMERVWKIYQDNLPKLQNIFWLYQCADLNQKQAMIRQVFNYSLYYQGGVYRTPYILPMFLTKAATVKQKRLLVIEQPLEKIAEFSACAPGGS